MENGNGTESKTNGTIHESNGGQVYDPLHGRSVNQKIDYALFADADITRDRIKGWLKNDLRGVYLVIAEILASNDCVEALTDVMYKRYSDLHKAKAEQTELNFPAK